MTSRLVIGFVFAGAMSGCLPPSVESGPAPRPLKPQDGPPASIYVDYYGGSFMRQIQTRFRVERGAYVMVGHLGGDGAIRVLYPETPRASGWVAGGKSITLKPHAAMYDMAPHLYSFATAPYRSLSSQLDSYDGLGHGYVFVIASRSPIDYDALAGGRDFDVLEVYDYETTNDPRFAVRSLADEIVSGPYTLRFATNASRSSYAMSTGCGTRWGLMTYGSSYYDHDLPWFDLGYSVFSYPGASLMNSVMFARYYGLGRSCRGSQYASHLYRGFTSRTVVGGVTPPPPAPVTPQLQRPTRRTLENPQRGPLFSGRSSFDRAGTLSSRAPARGSSFDGERYSRRPISGRPEYPTRTRDHEVTRPTHTEVRGPERASRPVDTPRLTTPSQPPTTTTSTATSGGETRAERPRPQP